MVGKQNNFKNISEQLKPTGLNRILSIKTHMRLLLMLIENTLFRKILILITRISYKPYKVLNTNYWGGR